MKPSTPNGAQGGVSAFARLTGRVRPRVAHVQRQQEATAAAIASPFDSSENEGGLLNPALLKRLRTAQMNLWDSIIARGRESDARQRSRPACSPLAVLWALYQSSGGERLSLLLGSVQGPVGQSSSPPASSSTPPTAATCLTCPLGTPITLVPEAPVAWPAGNARVLHEVLQRSQRSGVLLPFSPVAACQALLAFSQLPDVQRCLRDEEKQMLSDLLACSAPAQALVSLSLLGHCLEGRSSEFSHAVSSLVLMLARPDLCRVVCSPQPPQGWEEGQTTLRVVDVELPYDVRAPLWEEEEEEDGKEEGGVVEPEGKEVEAARPRRRWRLSSPVLAELVQGKLVQDDADYASAPLQLTKRALEVLFRLGFLYDGSWSLCTQSLRRGAMAHVLKRLARHQLTRHNTTTTGEGGPCPPPHTGLARWLCSPEEVVELVLARSFHCRACNGLWLHAVKEPPAFFLHILRELIVLDRRATYWTRRARVALEREGKQLAQHRVKRSTTTSGSGEQASPLGMAAEASWPPSSSSDGHAQDEGEGGGGGEEEDLAVLHWSCGREWMRGLMYCIRGLLLKSSTSDKWHALRLVTFLLDPVESSLIQPFTRDFRRELWAIRLRLHRSLCGKPGEDERRGLVSQALEEREMVGGDRHLVLKLAKKLADAGDTTPRGPEDVWEAPPPERTEVWAEAEAYRGRRLLYKGGRKAEQVALDHFMEVEGYKGAHAEARVFRFFLELLLFHQIRDRDVQGVWLKPYQTRPLDDESRHFYRRRAKQLDHRFHSLEQLCEACEDEGCALCHQGSHPCRKTRLFHEVARAWDEHSFRLIRFRKTHAWWLRKRQACEMAAALGRTLIFILRTLLQDVTTNKSGLPDLVLWKPIRSSPPPPPLSISQGSTSSTGPSTAGEPPAPAGASGAAAAPDCPSSQSPCTTQGSCAVWPAEGARVSVLVKTPQAGAAAKPAPQQQAGRGAAADEASSGSDGDDEQEDEGGDEEEGQPAAASEGPGGMQRWGEGGMRTTHPDFQLGDLGREWEWDSDEEAEETAEPEEDEAQWMEVLTRTAFKARLVEVKSRNDTMLPGQLFWHTELYRASMRPTGPTIRLEECKVHHASPAQPLPQERRGEASGGNYGSRMLPQW